jgi:hypothetical protein
LPKQENLIKKTGEELVEELNKSIDDYLATRNTPEQKKVGGFHPSYTNQCARYWYYLFEGTEVTPSFKSQTYRIFDNGHAVHERLYSYLRGMGILLTTLHLLREPLTELLISMVINLLNLNQFPMRAFTIENFITNQKMITFAKRKSICAAWTCRVVLSSMRIKTIKRYSPYIWSVMMSLLTNCLKSIQAYTRLS